MSTGGRPVVTGIISIFLFFWLCQASYAITPELNESRFDVYYGYIESQQHGDDQYKDIYLKAKPFYFLVGAVRAVPVETSSGYEDLMLCGTASGSFVICDKAAGARLPYPSTNQFDLFFAEFDGEGRSELLIRSSIDNINSVYLKRIWKNKYSIEQQFLYLDGHRVSGSPDVGLSRDDDSDKTKLSLGGGYEAQVEDGVFVVRRRALSYSLVGASESQFSVGKGAVDYTIPIQVASGGAGISPSVSLNYSSNNGYGQAGMGFSISGLSSIERCDHSYLKDGYKRAPTGTDSDVLCLDGNRLYLVDGSGYWANGSVYQTERETNAKVVYDNGVFTVWRKNGDVYRYGESANSRAQGARTQGATARWALSSVSDRLGYGYTFDYVEDTAATYPSKIQYTVNTDSSTGGYASIDFSYEQDYYNNTQALLGQRYLLNLRLSGIKSSVDGATLRSYYFFYEENPVTGRSLMTRYAECESRDNCFQPTELDWQHGGDIDFGNARYTGFDEDPNIHIIEYGYYKPGFNRWADINKDNIDDYCRISPSSALGGYMDIVCYYGDDSGHFNSLVRVDNTGLIGHWYGNDPYNEPQTNWNLDPSWQDINADGYVDLCYSTREDWVWGQREAGEDTLTCRLSSGGSGGQPVSFDQTITSEVRRPVANIYMAGRSWIDFNGDGKSDYCISYKKDDSEYARCYLREENGFSFQLAFTKSVSATGGTWVDVNGDGLPDYCAIKSSKITCKINNRGNDLSGDTWQKSAGDLKTKGPEGYPYRDVSTKYFSAQFVDFTGNGYPDYCRIYVDSDSSHTGYRASCLESTGEGWGQDRSSALIPLVSGIYDSLTYASSAEATQFMDVNEDGRVDWCIEKDAVLTCQLAEHDGFGTDQVSFTFPDLGVISPPDLVPLRDVNRGWADMNGDGVRTYCGLYWKSFNPHVQGMACYGPQEPSRRDYLTGVTNGFGLEYMVEYSDLSDPSVYSYDKHPGEDGQMYATSGMSVVSKLITSNGIGGYSEQEYFYENYAYMPNEIGGLGFEYIKVTSENGNKVAETWYSQDPYNLHAGRVLASSTSLRKPGGQLVTVREESKSWATTFYSDLGFQAIGPANIWDGDDATSIRYTVRLEESTTNEYDLVGQSVSATLTENSYIAGHLASQTVTTTGSGQVFTKVIDNQYYGDDFGNWIIGRLAESKTIHSHSYQNISAPALTRTSRWQYYQIGSPFAGMLKSETVEPDNSALSQTTTYNYNSFGLKESVVKTAPNALPRTTTYMYDARGRFVLEEFNSLGHRIEYRYDHLSGALVSTIDPNGLVERTDYDEVGRELRSISADGTTGEVRYRSCSYDCPDRAVYYVESWGTSSGGITISPVSKVYKDVLGRSIETRTQGFAGQTIIQKTEYDALGYERRVSEPYFQNDGPSWNVVVARDVKGRVTQKLNASGLLVNVTYSGLTTQTARSWVDPLSGASESRSSTVIKDVAGNKRQSVDTQGRAVAYSYDALSNLTRVDLPDGLYVENVYDVMGRRLSSNDPNMGTWKYLYDGFGQLVLQENGAGGRVCLEYDVLGRKVHRSDNYLATQSWSSAQSSAMNGCQGQPPTTSWTYDDPSKGIGRLAMVMTSQGYTQEPSYDALGRPVSTETTYEGQTYQSQRVYDQDTGRLLRRTPTHRQNGPSIEIEYSYNSLGFLTAMGKAGEQGFYWQVHEQNARGDVTEQVFANGMINQAMAYDNATGVMTQVRAKMALAPDWNIQNEHYVYAANGNMRQRAQQITSANQHLEEVFEYDQLDRLTRAGVANLNQPTLSFDQTVQYDASGNITQRNDVGIYTYGESCDYQGETYQPGPHAVTSVSGERNADYCYDAAGNMLYGDGRHIQYTAFNKPSFIESPDAQMLFVYGPDRQILKRVTTASDQSITKRVFSGYEHIETTEAGSTTVKERWTLPGGIVVSMEEGDETTAEEEYLFSDTLGSISAVANAMGGVSERHRYDPWGRPRATVDWSAITDGTWFAMNREETATSKGFTGHEMLDQVGIIHMGGRIYDPTLGRFMSADPVVKGLDNTESYNRYSYVRNSPMSYTDPSGYSWLSDAWDDITDFVKDHILEVAVAIVSPQVGLLGAMAAGYGGRELAQFAARNQYGGEVLGLIGTAVCSFATGGTGAAGCVTKFQGFSSMAIAHENGASIGQSLVAGVSSAALAGANIGIAGKIAGTGSNFAVSGALHGMRGGIFAGLSGGDARSGLIGGATEGVFGDWIQDWADDDTAGGTVMAGFISGSVSQATGGKFAVGAATGAMGYLFNQASRSAQEGLKPTSAEYQMVADGKLAEMWQGRCAAGDPIGCVGFATWGSAKDVLSMHGAAKGAYWLAVGESVRTNAKYGLLTGNPELMSSPRSLNAATLSFGKAIARTHLDATSADLSGRHYFLSAPEITAYHHQVFDEFNVSRRWYGGSYGTGVHEPIFESVYCRPSCDRY